MALCGVIGVRAVVDRLLLVRSKYDADRPGHLCLCPIYGMYAKASPKHTAEANHTVECSLPVEPYSTAKRDRGIRQQHQAHAMSGLSRITHRTTPTLFSICNLLPILAWRIGPQRHTNALAVAQGLRSAPVANHVAATTCYQNVVCPQFTPLPTGGSPSPSPSR